MKKTVLASRNNVETAAIKTHMRFLSIISPQANLFKGFTGVLCAYILQAYS